MNFEYRGYKCNAEWDYESKIWLSGVYLVGTNGLLCVEGVTPVEFYKDMQEAVDEYEEFKQEMAAFYLAFPLHLAKKKLPNTTLKVKY